MSEPLYTIGHSTHSMARLVALLRQHDIRLVCDVRSAPYSRFNPQFRREALQTALHRADIGYLYLGDALGGKPRDPDLPSDDRARYALIAHSDRFRAGLDRLLTEAASRRTVVLCAEQDPEDCHRSHLICAHLPADTPIRHILADGSLVDHDRLPASERPDDPRQPRLF